jgi:diacylglycerol kinase (ATP)
LLRKIINSFGYAFRGIAHVFQTQRNARIHTSVAVFVTASGFFFHITSIEWCFVVFCITMVWSAEALNTSNEPLVDLVSPDYHPLAGYAKDAAAAFVLLLAIGAFCIGSVIFIPKTWAYLFG